MLETENLLYFDVVKTGSSHIIKILREVLTEDFLYYGKHVHLNEKSNKFKLCSIRNPWDWYVSLWSFGCEGRGRLFQELGRRHSYLYRDKSKPPLFRQWVKLIHDPEVIETDNIGPPFYARRACRNLGIFTYRYLATVHPRFRRTFESAIDSYAETLSLHRGNQDIDSYIRLHELEHDMISSLDKSRLILRKNYGKTIHELSAKPTNTSGRNGILFTEYYDDETKELVSRRDQLIIDQFGFKFDPKECVTSKFDRSNYTGQS